MLAEGKLDELENKIKNEQKEHREWLTLTKEKADAELARAISKTDALEIKKRDLIVVEKRLKKLWSQTSETPFPKVYDA